jgi:hypothetical protein
VYRDKYGQIRNTPQQNCAATLAAGASGDYIVQRVTSDRVDFNRYTSNSSAPMRCFDGQWSLEPPDAVVCEVLPKDCPAQTVTYNGCSFDVPSTGHDEIFTNRNPAPFASSGHVETYCFDGQLEIKSQSCALSCDGNPVASVWAAENVQINQNCSHNAVTGQPRVPPGSILTIANTEAGMNGSLARQCVNGSLVVEPNAVCRPAGCSSVPSNTWTTGDSMCTHSAREMPSVHGGDISISSADVFNTSGYIQYSCQFGEYTAVDSECLSSESPMCIDTRIDLPEPITMPGGPVNDPDFMYCAEVYGREGMIRMGDICCGSEANTDGLRRLVCYQIP